MTTCSNILPIVPQLTSDPVSQYAHKLLLRRNPEYPIDTVLREMEALAEAENIPIIGPLEGAIIQAILALRIQEVKNVLDIGSAIGYSAIWLARSLPPHVHIVSIEIDPDRAIRAKEFINRSGYGSKIDLIIGDIFDVMPKLGISFDVIFQDVIKHAYFSTNETLAMRLLNLCINHLSRDGVLLSDNAYCMGHVENLADPGLPKQIQGIIAYNDILATNTQLESVIIPVRDGLWITRKTGKEPYSQVQILAK